MAVQERDVERYLISSVRKAGGQCLKWVCPGTAGVPDRIILLPGGHVHFVELKRPDGGVVSKLQIVWHNRLRKLGFSTWFISSREGVRAFIKETVEGKIYE